VDEFGHTAVMVTQDPVAAGHADGLVFLGRIGKEAAAKLDLPYAIAVAGSLRRLARSTRGAAAPRPAGLRGTRDIAASDPSAAAQFALMPSSARALAPG
jgi:hypothetical protein